MNEPELEAALAGIVIKNSRVQVKSVAREQCLAADLGFDSLAFLLTIGDLEERFGIAFPLERIEELSDITFGELVGLVRRELV